MTDSRLHLSIEPCTILQADGFPGAAAFEIELSERSGMTLPSLPGEVVVQRQWRIVRMAPRRFWFIDDESPPLRWSINPEVGCLVSLSESRSRLSLRGAHVWEVVAGSAAIDFRCSGTASLRAFQTSIHHIPVLLLPTAADACDLFAPRSFSRSLAEWLIDVAAGYPTQGDRAPFFDRP